ncbi:MAG: S8 family serine peptidase [Cyanobacteria bacterium NC_groundwater_1444_Ag_S-0.65um_54_12]|nr:S8 family serine peptidase [Cyanobacteria bacterium NC_groundwater_1444_Ag_S-0.65um_54_12]
MSLCNGRRASLWPLIAIAISGTACTLREPLSAGQSANYWHYSLGYRPHDLLIGYQQALTPAKRAHFRNLAGVLVVEPILSDSERWILPEGIDPLAAAKRINTLPGLRYAQPNYRRRLQAYAASEFDPGQEAKNNPLWHLKLLDLNRTWASDKPANLPRFSGDYPPGKGIMVAVVDSGVDVKHPDLSGNIARNAEGKYLFLDEIKACGQSDVLAGAGGQTLVYDWVTAYDNPQGTGPDGNGHGTHVAGIIAAIGNNIPGLACQSPPCNTVGTAPGVTILPVKTMDAQGDGDDYCIARGLRDAADAGARIINLSVGGPDPGPMLAEVIVYLAQKGVVLVVASGNDGLRVNYPAAYPGAIAVGAIGNPNDALFPDALNKGLPYSSRGPQLALVAPGGSDTEMCPEKRCGIYSTVPTYSTFISLHGKVTGTVYGRLTGTSMATPQVTGVAAMILAREPQLTPEQVRERILASTSPVSGTDGTFSERYGYGLLNPYRALTLVSHDGK